MNKLKFTNYNALGKPQNVILTTNEGREVLHWWPHTRYYDKADKKYDSNNNINKIKNEIYVKKKILRLLNIITKVKNFRILPRDSVLLKV